MNSLDAILKSQADRAKLYKKFSQENPRVTPLPKRILKPMRLRPGEISREEFGNFFGAIAPNTGIVNEFRTQMYQSEMRGLNNRIALANKQPHPGWALWGYGALPAVEADGVLTRNLKREENKLVLTLPPAHPGIQLFFQTPCTDTPLYGSGMSGGALSQLPRTARGYRKTEAAVIKNSRDQARQLTAMRSGQAAAPPLPPVLTALDEAKLSIATSIETIAQQLFRGIYTPGILRDLTVVSATIARNAPLMDTNALTELFRYVSDLTAMLRSNAKNIGKEIAEDGLAMSGSLALGVARDSNVAEAIFARVEAIGEFLKRQLAVAERPVGERVAVARGALPLLGTNVDRKTYPEALRKKFAQDEIDEAERRRAEAEQAMAARDALEAVPDVPVPMEAPAAPAEEMEVEARLEMFFNDATDAARRGDLVSEEENLRGALALAARAGEVETVRIIEDVLVRRGFARAIGAEEVGIDARAEAVDEGEKAPDAAPAVRFGPVPLPVFEGEELANFLAELEEFGVTPDNAPALTKIPRNGQAIAILNDFLKRNARRIITRTGKDMSLQAVLKQAAEKGIDVIESASGERIPINEAFNLV